MTGKALISVSFCCAHFKGGDGINQMHGEEHWRWLEECLDHLRATYNLPLIVACTGYPGILDVNNSPDDCSRDVAWRIIAKGIPIMGTVHNPGHQVGAAQCIRIGLEYAAKCGYDYLIHTAEDVMPQPGTIAEMIRSLEEGYAYAGQRWGHETGAYLNAQFFGCRVSALVGVWDACRVSEFQHIEGMLRAMIGQQSCRYLPDPVYQTTHQFAEWRSWREAVERA